MILLDQNGLVQDSFGSGAPGIRPPTDGASLLRLELRSPGADPLSVELPSPLRATRFRLVTGPAGARLEPR